MTNQEKGLDFEKQCFSKLTDLGFTDLSLTKSTDNGADIIGTFNGTKYVFQCKNHYKPQGNRCVQEVIAAQKLYKGNRCVVISNSSFTAAAIALAKANNCILLQAVELFELSEFPPPNYSKRLIDNTIVYDLDYQLIEKYESIKKIVGRPPKWNELNKNIRYMIKKKYKNYGNFLSSIGDDKYTTKHTDEELQKEYIRIRTLLNKVPTGTEIRENSAFPYNQFREYPLTRLQKECGDRPNIERGVPKEALKCAYFELESELGHPPAVKDIDLYGKYRSSYYVKRWGSIDSFLSEIGRTRTAAGLPRRYSKDELVAIYSCIKILLSLIYESDEYIVNQTTLEKLRIDNKSLISPTTFTHKFTTWKAFRQYVEENKIDSALERIVNKIRDEGIDALLSIDS
ncbi:MAG: restriction endonuclease [Oscillospiraceae bacterium]|nr:restriction endonuclease [Oscillospiraceae bacterium]